MSYDPQKTVKAKKPRKKNPSLTPQVQAEVEKRRGIVAQNLLAGATYRFMAEALGVSLATISSDVKVINKRWRDEAVQTIAEFKALELRRTEVLINSIFDEATTSPDLLKRLAAIDRVVKIVDQRAKLMNAYEIKVNQQQLNASGEPTNPQAIQIIATSVDYRTMLSQVAPDGVEGMTADELMGIT